MPRALPILLLTLLLAGCSSARDVRLLVRDADSREPAAGVRVRAISLDSGTVPLPLNDDTIDEILSTGAVASAATTDHRGVVRLRIRARVPHALELLPPPLGLGAPNAGESSPASRFILSEDHAGVRRNDDAPGPDRFLVEVQR